MNKKKLLVIGGAALAVMIMVTILAVSFGNPKPLPVEPTESKSPESSQIMIEQPDNADDSTSDETVMQEIEDDGNALKPNESIETERPKNTGTKAESNQTPVVKAEPSQEAENNNSAGIQIGGNAPVEEAYHCGYDKHHCQNAGYHASLLNRELEGCPYCGSHSCISFYERNEWGYTEYNPKVCPQYNAKEDPAEYCPDCKLKKWSPNNPTGCFRYLQDTQCECGELVSGNTCHHH